MPLGLMKEVGPEVYFRNTRITHLVGLIRNIRRVVHGAEREGLGWEAVIKCKGRCAA